MSEFVKGARITPHIKQQAQRSQSLTMLEAAMVMCEIGRRDGYTAESFAEFMSRAWHAWEVASDWASPVTEFPGSLSELLKLRDTDPDRYEQIMTEVQKRADAAQKALIKRATDTSSSGTNETP